MKFGYPQIVNIFGICLLLSTLQLARLTLLNFEYKSSLTQHEMHQDLDFLLQQVEQHSALSSLNPEKFTRLVSKIEPLLFRLSHFQETQAFYTEILKLLAILDDPGLTIFYPRLEAEKLPFTLRVVADSWLALGSNSQLLDEDHPFITHIDGIPITRWEQASQKFLSGPEKQSLSARVDGLSQLSMLRYDMGLPHKASVLLSLTDNADSNMQLSLPINSLSSTKNNASILGKLLWSNADLLPTYIPIADLADIETDPKLATQLDDSLQQPMTILDLRNSNGNNDKLLSWIANHYADVPPAVHNTKTKQSLMAFGQYRRSLDFKSDFLKPLGFLPFDELSFFEQIEFSQASQDVTLSENSHFGLWYGKRSPVLTQAALKPPDPSLQPHLVLLIGPECRRECEWIVYFAKSLSRVTLIGEKTSGDFGRHYAFILPNSGIKIELTASLTYSMQGDLLSGIGTQPDISLPINDNIHWQGLVSLIVSEPTAPQVVYNHKTPPLKEAKFN
ncbi:MULTISPECIES: S41 family peptidase [Shewanella]|nr:MULTISPECIES: S41 family peptidase [Shewanella]